MSRVLLLESDALLASSVSTRLAKNDHTVDWQVDPQAAIEAIDKNPVQAVIMDLLLAGRSGVEFLYELRSYPEWQKLPVIVFSNSSASELGRVLPAFEQLNVNDYLYKPATTLTQLVNAVERNLQSGRL